MFIVHFIHFITFCFHATVAKMFFFCKKCPFLKKIEQTKSLAPTICRSQCQIIYGYLAIRICYQTFCVVGVLRCCIFSGLCSSTKCQDKSWNNKKTLWSWGCMSSLETPWKGDPVVRARGEELKFVNEVYIRKLFLLYLAAIMRTKETLLVYTLQTSQWICYFH